MKCIVLGGGLSGLSCAWFLQKHFPQLEISVIEKSERFGGWIQTIEREGMLFELGPKGFIPQGKGIKTLELCHELHLDNEMLKAAKLFKNRYIYQSQSLKKIPSTFLGLMTHPYFLSLIPTFLNEKKVPPYQGDETIAHFFTRRFNKRFADKLIDPIITGIYAGDIEQLSLQACLPRLKKMENEFGSLVKAFFRQKKKGTHELISFNKGMETLPKTLYEALKTKVNFIHSHSITKIEKEKNQCIIYGMNKKWNADIVISCLPSNALKSIFPEFFKDFFSS